MEHLLYHIPPLVFMRFEEMLATTFSMWELITWIRKPASGLFKIAIHQKQAALC